MKVGCFLIPLVYDQINKWSIADEFYLNLLKKISVNNIADLGCGTGRLTSVLATEGYNMTGIDPNSDSIEYAKHKKGSNFVNWIKGDSNALYPSKYNAVIMTGNVAQVFINETSWQKTITDVYKSLETHGHFIFDTRNPIVKPWLKWELDDTPDYAIHPVTGEQLEIWTEYDGFIDGIYTFSEKVIRKKTNEIILHEKMKLKFRSYEEILQTLNKIGFSEIRCYGDWKIKDATNSSDSFIFHAIK